MHRQLNSPYETLEQRGRRRIVNIHCSEWHMHKRRMRYIHTCIHTYTARKYNQILKENAECEVEMAATSSGGKTTSSGDDALESDEDEVGDLD